MNFHPNRPGCSRFSPGASAPSPSTAAAWPTSTKDPATAGRAAASGNPTWGYLYRDFVEPLVSAGYRAIAPDWIGAGYSDHPREDAALTLAHHIADLVSLLDQLDLRGFVIVGQDWGGPQGIGAALRRIDAWARGPHEYLAVHRLISKFHASPKPWTTWHAPLVGQFFMKRHKVLSHTGRPPPAAAA